MTKSKELLAFEDWLYAHNTPGGNKAGSYVTVIEHIGPILRKLPQFADLPVDICTIDDVAKLRAVRAAVLAEQKKPDGAAQRCLLFSCFRHGARRPCRLLFSGS